MPVLGLPLLLIGLTALPVVAGIYWLRTRYRRQEVSTLFLWRSSVEAQGGGRKKNRLQTPLALLLELLAIALLVLAATAPRVLRAGHTAAVVVVLDDSYSMTATAADAGGGASSARDRAVEALREELSALPQYTLMLVVAGPTPQVLGGSATTWGEVEASLEQWRPAAGTADLGAALVLAGEVGGPQSRLLVLSDGPMPGSLREGSRAGRWLRCRPRGCRWGTATKVRENRRCQRLSRRRRSHGADCAGCRWVGRWGTSGW